MQFEEIKKVYENYSKSKIEEKEAVKKLVEILYFNTSYFKNKNFNKKTFNNFYIYSYESLSNIFSRYDSEKSSILTFVYNTIAFQIKSWERNQCLKKINNEFDESYMKNEYICLQNYVYEPQCSYLENENEELPDIYIDNKKLDKNCLLILALKISYYLTDKSIERLAKKININPDVLWQYKLQADESLVSKIKKLEKYKTKICKAYYYKIRHEYSLDYLEKNNLKFIQTKYSQKFQDELWKKTLSDKIKIYTSNRIIAQILNLSEYQVKTKLRKIRNYLEKQN